MRLEYQHNVCYEAKNWRLSTVNYSTGQYTTVHQCTKASYKD